VPKRPDDTAPPRLYRPPRGADPDDTPFEPQSRRMGRAPGIDVEYTLDRAGSRDRTMVEVWTKNRIYRVDASLKCIAVVVRDTGEPDTETRLIGAHLSGGESRRSEEDVIDLFYPLPVPGCVAVFNDTTKYRKVMGHTTRVERVVLRVHKTRVRGGEADESWDSVTGRFRT
jgi:hypothetical protein